MSINSSFLFPKSNISLSPLKITVIYLVVAGLWIAFTDELLQSLVSDPQYLSTLQTYKGLFYVIITGAGLYWLIIQHDRQLGSKESELTRLVEELRSEKELTDKLFERIPVLITIYDPELESFEVNKEYEKVIGWTNKEIDTHDIDLLDECYPDNEIQKEVVEFMNNPGIGWKEFPMQTKEGTEIPTSWTNIKLTDDTSVGIGIDMSEIKASQAQIRESQKLLRKIFESLKSSLIILDYKSRTIIDCNKSTEELFGYSKEELKGNSTRMLHISEEKFEQFNLIGADILKEKGVFQTEFVMQRKDGGTFYSDHTVTLVYDEEGKIDKVVSLIRDITERKNHEQELKRQKERLLRSQKIGQIGDWEFDIKTEEITWSPTMYEIFERDPELGPPAFRDIQNNYYKEQSEQHNKTIQQAIDEGQSSYDIDLPLQTDRGNKKFIRVIITPVKDESGNVVKLRGIVQDITERKETELALHKNKERIQNITNNVPGVVFRYILEKDGSDRMEFISKGAKEIWGAPPHEAQKNNNLIWENIHPSDIDRLQKSIQKSAKTLTKWNEEWRYIKPDGSVHWQNGIGIPSKRENGSIVWDSIILDITNRKKLEKELSKERQRFELVAETTSDVIWDLDFKKQELWWSKGFEKTFGLKRKTPKENYKAWKEFIHPEDREKVAESSKKALQSDAKRWVERYRLIKADGSIAHLVDRAIIIRDEQGEAIRMVGAMDDITERKKAEQKLRESEEKYRHLFENNPEPMWIYDPNTLEFVEVNQAAINHYGYSEEEFLKMTLLDIRPKKDAHALKQNVKENMGSPSYSEEWVHLKKDGTKIDVELSAADVSYTEDKTYRLVLINDITQQKRMQEKIIQSVIEGEDRERKRIAHELHDGLGQYLVAANMNFQSVQIDSSQLPKKRQKQFETGLSLLKNALSETRSIAHNLMPKAISDYGLLAALENLFKDLQKSTDIEFHFNHNCDNLNLKNQAEINIYRIFQETISNAVRHANCSTIWAELQLNQDTLTINIGDDGIGANLDEEDQDKGLGLRSIKTRVNNLKGTLDIKGKSGEGMQTIITIPDIHNLQSNHTE